VAWGKKTASLKGLEREGLTREAILECIEKGGSSIVRLLSDTISIRKSKKGADYVYYKTPAMKKPGFFTIVGLYPGDYKVDPDSDILQWIQTKYTI